MIRSAGIVFCAYTLLWLCSNPDATAQAIKREWHKDLFVYAPAEAAYSRVAKDQSGQAYWAVNCRDSATSLQYIWLNKYDTSGKHLWSYYYDAFHGALFTDLTCDAAGNTYLLGTAMKAAANGTNAVFLRKYNPNGALLWSVILDADPGAEETPDQLALSPVNGDVLITFTSYLNVHTLFLARLNPQGNLLWQKSFLNYRAGDLLIGPNEHIHLLTTYFHGSLPDDKALCYLQLDSQGNFVNSFTQSGGQYSHPLETGGTGRTMGMDHAGNIYALGWVKTFPFQDTTWTNIMVYKFNAVGNQLWSYRIKRLPKAWPGSYCKLAVDPNTGNTLIVGGTGMWKYDTNGSFVTGWFNAIRSYVDVAMLSVEKTFTLSSTMVPNGTDNGKISHVDWTKNDTLYVHGRADVQLLNTTAIIEPDTQRLAMYVTWCYKGKAELHRLVLRDFITNSLTITQNLPVTIFPNPATDAFFIAADELSAFPVRISLKNSSGREVRSWFLHQPQTDRLSVLGLPSGLYLLTITDPQRQQSAPLVIH